VDDERLAEIRARVDEMMGRRPGDRCCGECCSAQGCGLVDDAAFLLGELDRTRATA
jgi:hypothetical protein